MSNIFYKYKGLFWEPYQRMAREGRLREEIRGPFCPKCKAEMTNRASNEAFCEVCEQGYLLNPSIDKAREIAYRMHCARLREGHQIIALDLPPTLVKSEDEDDNYWVEARIGEKNGKIMGIVYFGKKIKGTQNKKDYTQTFIDFDDEQMRFDKANKNPMEIVGKLKAEFLGSIHTSEKK